MRTREESEAGARGGSAADDMPRACARAREGRAFTPIVSRSAGRADEQTRPRAPRSLAHALEGLAAELAPVSLLGRVQTVWERATGPRVAAAASPVAEREGVLTVLCESSVWAHELEMLSSELIDALNVQLGSEAVVKLRCRSG
jgi:predicted nucleic acid-binding Zn ribbon protein